MKGTPAARFTAKIMKTKSCWLWAGAIDAKDGYGRFGLNGKVALAHRVSWELANGPIPKGEGFHGMCVCHSCDVRVCVNPEHLFLGSHLDNMRDREAKGRTNSGGVEKAKTHCPQGHEYAGENLRINKRGARVCRACNKQRLQNRKKGKAE